MTRNSKIVGNVYRQCVSVFYSTIFVEDTSVTLVNKDTSNQGYNMNGMHEVLHEAAQPHAAGGHMLE